MSQYIWRKRIINVKFRKANLDDLNRISKIDELFSENTMGKYFLENEIRNSDISTIYLLESKNDLIGFLIIRINDMKAEIVNFVIDLKFQNKGFGFKLLSNVIKDLKIKSVKSIKLDVRKKNIIARNLYEKKGFERLGINKSYYLDDDALIYIRYL